MKRVLSFLVCLAFLLESMAAATIGLGSLNYEIVSIDR